MIDQHMLLTSAASVYSIVCLLYRNSPEAVIMELVVAGKGDKAPPAW